MVLTSVVLAVHNGEPYVSDAVRSVLSQTHADLELIVVDDGSSDATAATVTAFEDRRVRLIRQQQSGVAAARNRGMREARGEVVAFLDHDDVWFPDKLASQIPAFDRPGIGVVGSFMTYMTDHGPVRATAGEKADHQRERVAAARLMPFPPSAMVVRAALVRSVGGFDEELARVVGPVDDLDMISRLARVSDVVTVARPLGYYRLHRNASSFVNFQKVQRGTRFLQARRAAERAGGVLTWEQWSSATRDGWSVRRRDRANLLYRSAGFELVAGGRARGAVLLVAAAALAPGYVGGRLRRQLRGGGR